MMKTVRAENIDEKKWYHLQSFHVSFLTYMVLKLPKKVHFLQLCVDLSKKSKSVKVIYVYTSESSHNFISENGMVYTGLSHR